MPNYIKNRLELVGDEKDVQSLVKKFSTKINPYQNTSFDGDLTFNNDKGEYGWLNKKTNKFKRRDMEDVDGVPKDFKPSMVEGWTRFPDFNKIIPMPEDLDIQIHSGIETAVKASLKMPLPKNSLIRAMELSSRDKRESPLNFSDEDFEMYLKALRNVKNHGYVYWYDWSIEKWGTKWNSTECDSEGNIFEFETAWSGVPELIKEMHMQFPSVKILYKYSDEDTGSNCGVYVFENGEEFKTVIENRSKEAFEIAFELRPEYINHYELVDGEYQYIEED